MSGRSGQEGYAQGRHAPGAGRKCGDWAAPGNLCPTAASPDAVPVQEFPPRAEFARALADLVVVDGDPVADLSALSGEGETVRLVMKGAAVFKDTL